MHDDRSFTWLTIAKPVRVEFRGNARHDRRMLELVIAVVPAFTLALRGDQELVVPKKFGSRCRR